MFSINCVFFKVSCTISNVANVARVTTRFKNDKLLPMWRLLKTQTNDAFGCPSKIQTDLSDCIATF